MIQLARDMPIRHKTFPKGMSPILDSLRSPGLNDKPVTEVPALIRMLREGSMAERSSACVGIAELAKSDPEKARETVPALIEAFNRWGAMTKAVIAETFVELQDWRALPSLVKNADAKNPELRARIEWALSNIPAVILKPIE